MHCAKEGSGMSFFRIVCLFFVFGVTQIMLTGAYGDERVDEAGEEEDAVGEASKIYDWVIGFSQSNLTDPWRRQMGAYLQEITKEYPGLTVFYKDAKNDEETQAMQIGELIDLGVDVIIVSPRDSKALTKPVEEAMALGIPVVVLDRKVNTDKYTCFITADNEKIAREAGKYLVKKLGGKGNVVELQGLMTSTPAQERSKGFRDGIRGSDIKIVFKADMSWLEETARREMQAILGQLTEDGKKLDAVFGANDPGAYGAYLAVKNDPNFDEKKIVFVGLDGLDNEGVKYVKAGIFDATFTYATGGDVALDTAIRILEGQKVEKKILLGTRKYTGENVETGGELIEFDD